jgi:signal transduction histidine kinase
MSQLSAPAETIASPSASSSPTLHGHWHVLARGAWAAVAILAVSLFLAAIPVHFTNLSNPDLTVRAGLAQFGISINSYALYRVALTIVLTSVFCTVGVLIFLRKSDERLALFVALMLVTFGTQSGTSALVEALPTWELAIRFLGFLAWSSLGLFLYTFPDGHFVPGWTRVAAIMWIALQVNIAFFPDSLFSGPTPLSLVLALGFWSSMLLAQIYRYRYVSGPVQRQQTKWLVLGFTAAFLTGLLLFLLGTVIPSLANPESPYQLLIDPIIELVFLAIPVSIGIAVLRYRLWDIDPIINRTLVYGALTASVVGIYVLVVGYLGAVFQTGGNFVISLLATGIVAVLFQPLRERLQRGVNRLMYGKRDEPYAVISQLGQRLEAALAPDAILPTVVETVKEALKLPHAAIALKQDDSFEIVAASGDPIADPLRLRLVYQNETVGELVLAPRASGETFSPADRRLLDDLARQAGVAAHAVRLHADLQRSRERLVTTREEERRRLRRDLHDGLGPQLAALNLQAGVLRKLIPCDPAAADALVVELRREIRSAIANIRHVVYELRPPALDELGLVAAIRQQAANYSTGGTLATEAGLQVVVEAPEQLPALPAAVEVAVYRIVHEALANVVHHAHACSCIVRVSITDALHLEIVDDGVGLPAIPKTGVGLLSIRERTAELGGTCTIEPLEGGGTHVRVQLPLTKREDDGRSAHPDH